MNERFKRYYRDIAQRTAELSRAKRLKVGAIIVKDNRIISIGYNGTPSGWSNYCEKPIFPSASGGKIDIEDIEEEFPLINELGNRFKWKTLPEVIHAEENCLGKLARSNESGEGATMFLTHSPCIYCSKMIYTAGIKTVYYNTPYRSTEGIDFLLKAGVNVVHFK